MQEDLEKTEEAVPDQEKVLLESKHAWGGWGGGVAGDKSQLTFFCQSRGAEH